MTNRPSTEPNAGDNVSRPKPDWIPESKSGEERGGQDFQRQALTVTGTVQGVGFRPFVYRLALRHRLHGFVRNQREGVRVEVEGARQSVREFMQELAAARLPLARIEAVRSETMAPQGDDAFCIAESPAGSLPSDAADFIPPDVATCGDCLAEVFDPTNRRYRYPFTNCVNCGPRLTLIGGLPYDRERTTMASFKMCAQCRAEYEDPADRRFHAEPNACPDCGPRLILLGAEGGRIEAPDPMGDVAARIRAGGIGALKGLGGFHLICDAASESAVRELRRRKGRDEKPLAVMVPDLAAVRRCCETSPAAEELLLAPERPIVLVRRRANGLVATGVAPGNPLVGVMLPYTPLHHLLLAELAGQPLVVTSGNRTDAPMAVDDDRVVVQLAGLADFILTHDRAIQQRCDDSVWRMDSVPIPLRRSRGFAPSPIRLPVACARPILAVGGQLKAVAAFGRGNQAVLTHHLGDLDEVDSWQAYEEAMDRYQRLLGFKPELIAHDLHPDYATTRHALERQRNEGIACLGVQHHHAHIASAMAEHGLTDPVIGVAFDGTGYGPDGTVWGGEFLVADARSFERAAHLRGVAMPGGEAAIREPWRMALAHLRDAGEMDAAGEAILGGVPGESRSLAAQLIATGCNAPLTSSAGRLFDAVAAILGLRHRTSFEGQAASELEWVADEGEPGSGGAFPFELTRAEPGPWVVDTRPMIRAIVRERRTGLAPGMVARRFHSTLAEVIATVAHLLRERTGIGSVVLSGGVFMNAMLVQEATARLAGMNFRIHRHGIVPPNDGGLALGQLAIAAARDGGR